MTRWMTAVFSVLLAALAAAVIVQSAHLRRHRREADQMRLRIERLESRQQETAAATQAAVEEVQEQVARQAEKAAEAMAPAPAPRPGADAGAAFPVVTDEDIRRIVDEKVEEKLQARGEKEQGGERKMPLHDLAKELGLEPLTQKQVSEIANMAKKDIFELLRTPRPDGTHLADDLLDAFMSGEQERIQGIFLRIFTENVPGTNTLYVAAAGRIQETANQGLERAMGPDLYARFRHMNVRPENIETGYDPWGEYLAQRGPR